MYTELDIGNPLPETPRGADAAAFLNHRDGVTRVIFPVMRDADSWLNRGRMNYPLLWDRQRQAKPSFNAGVDAPRSAR